MTLQEQWRREREARRERRESRNNAGIRPWVSVGEAAELALSKIVKNMQDAKEKK